MNNLQREVMTWAKGIFGNHAKNRIERASRLLEEAVELVQAEGLPPSTALKIVEHVYGRSVGETETEAADVFTTLLALCENREISLYWTWRHRFDQISAPEFKPILLESQDRKANAGIGVKIR